MTVEPLSKILGGRGFKDGRETKEGVREFPIVFGNKRFDKKLICLLNRRDTVESKFVKETILEGQFGTFYDTFCVRNAGSFELKAKLSTGEVELGKNIFAFVLHSGRAMIKDRTVVSLEFGRDAVITKRIWPKT